MIEPNAVFLGLAGLVFTVAGFELGMAFLMRGERESSRVVSSFEVKDR